MSYQDLWFYALLVTVTGFVLSYIFSFFTRRWAVQYRALDMPRGGRKIHKQPTPLWGGLGILLALMLVILFLCFDGAIFLTKISIEQIVGFLLGLIVLNVGGMLDDKYTLKPWQSIIFPILASLLVIISGTTIMHVTSPATSGAWYLNWWTWRPLDGFYVLSLPGDAITFMWLMVAIYATKITDGLDGLVTGITVIGAAMVGLLSALPTYFQPGSVILAAAVGGSYLGFLPANKYPAKQFLGEGGSTMAGFCLGFLAIVSSAKIAIAMAVLAIPVADIFFVVLRRWWRHQNPFKGDDTHLHFRLRAAGLPYKTTIWLLWLVSAAAGSLALTLQTRGKIFLVGMMVILTGLISWLVDSLIKRKTKLKPTE